MTLQNVLLNVTEKAAGATEKATKFEVLNGDESFLDRLLYGLRVAAIGLLVVFLVLLILWAIVTVMGKLLGKPRKTPEAVKQPPEPVNNGNAPEASEEETVVAIASAAIAAYEGKAEVDFDVVSVTPVTFTEEK